MRKMSAYSLIELVVFITVLGLVGSSLLLALNVSLQNSPSIEATIQASNLAQARMELIIGQRYLLGFLNFEDPCVIISPPAVCTVPAGYTVSATIAPSWEGDINYKVITVAVSGLGTVSLTGLVGND